MSLAILTLEDLKAHLRNAIEKLDNILGNGATVDPTEDARTARDILQHMILDQLEVDEKLSEYEVYLDPR